MIGIHDFAVGLAALSVLLVLIVLAISWWNT